MTQHARAASDKFGANKHLTAASKQEARAKIAELDRKGYQQGRIAQLMGISQGQVSKYLRKIKAEYASRIEQACEAKIQEKLEQYRDIRREAWEAWELSRGCIMADLMEQCLKQIEDNIELGLPMPETLNLTLRATPANEFLTTVLKTLEAERKLQGLDVVPEEEGNTEAKAALWDALVAAAPEGPVPDDVESRVMREIQALPASEARPNGDLPDRLKEQAEDGDASA